MIKIITGPPASGKTTTYVQELAKSVDSLVWVQEPVQKLVDEKNIDLKNKYTKTNIRFINYASGLSNKFFLDFLKKQEINKVEDYIVIDEAHQLLYTEFRNFEVNNLEEILALYKNIIFITATPDILEMYLKYYSYEYEKIEFKQRLKRDKIIINIFPTIYSSFINKDKIKNYDIILINNIKNLKKTELYFDNQKDISFIYSYYNEINNLYFNHPKKAPEDNIWIGTSAMGQGLNKFNVLKKNNAKVLFDGNTFLQVPDIIKRDKRFQEEDTNETIAVKSKCLSENVIQSDRFRVDLDILEIDLLIDFSLEHCDILKNVLEDYIKSVYRDNKDIKINIGDGLYANKLEKFDFALFEKCLNEYNPYHTNNTKEVKTRFFELLNDWCNPIKGGERTKGIGSYKSTIKYFKLLYH